MTEDRITLSGSVGDRTNDGYGVEFDLTPAAARRLAAQLLAAGEGLASGS